MLRRTNPWKAAGPDNIPGRALRVCSAELAEVPDIYNLSLSLSSVPTCFTCLFIDYSSAFNTVLPTKLAEKLLILGLTPSLCSWVLDFLTDRPQTVRVGTQTSGTRTVCTGTPQGCVLSPLLYTLFTYDCAPTQRNTTIIKFADDTTVIGLVGRRQTIGRR